MMFRIKILDMGRTVSIIAGHEVSSDMLTVKDMHEIPELEAKLEKLTGLRFHIEVAHYNTTDVVK